MFHYWIGQLAIFYLQEFKITFPSLNYPPTLWKYATAISLPVEVYSITTKLSNLLSLTEFRLADHEKWKRSHGTPDSKLMALLIVACKLGFDLEHTREWTEWATATPDKQGKDKNAQKDDITEMDILEMSDEKLDEYIDWMQSTWINDAEESRTS